MKSRLAIYPFSDELFPILLHQDKIKDYEIVLAVIPVGWVVDDEITNKYKDIICSEDKFYSDHLISTIDIIFLAKPIFLKEFTIYDRIIDIAQKNEKTIIFDFDIDFKLQNCSGWKKLEPEEYVVQNKMEIFTIDVPIVMILGLGENCDKWEIQLDLYDYFIHHGYKVSLISSNLISQFMGAHTFPIDINKPELTFFQQVKKLNSFIKNIEIRDKPNLIILGVPGGIMKYSQSVPNGYGYLPFLICNAVTPDISVLSLYCGEYTEEHIKKLQSTCLYKYGINVKYFHISQKVLNYDFEAKQLNYYTVKYPYLIERIINPHKFLSAFNIFNIESRIEIFDSIMKELQSNVGTV